MKPYEFFIRFDLQRSSMAFPLENFPYEKTPDASPREIDAYLAACEAWISTAAERLKQTTGAEKSKDRRVLYLGDSLTATASATGH